MITVVGMGRQRGDLTANGAEAIRRADAVVVKSALTHAAEDVAQIRSDAIFCDDLYQQAQDFEQLNDLIAERLRSFGGKKVVFCVAGDGSDDSTVQRLDGVRVIAGVGFQSAVVGNDMPAGTVFYTAQDICSAKRVLPRPTVVKCIDDKYIASEVQLKLLTAFEPTTRAVFCCGTRTKQIRLDEGQSANAYFDNKKRYRRSVRTCRRLAKAGRRAYGGRIGRSAYAGNIPFGNCS